MTKKKVPKSDNNKDSTLDVPDILGSTNDIDEESDTGGSATGKKFTEIIQHIIMFCGFPEDSIMVDIIKQQGWTELEHVTTIGYDEVKELILVRDDGMYLGSPMMVHIRMFKAFLYYY